MSDLTKLTAEEFSRRIDNCDFDIEERIELDRRLERLEKCEASLKVISAEKEDLLDDYDRQAGRLAKCEAAMKPFAALAKEVDLLRHDDESTCLWAIKAGDLRAARAALEGK